MKIWLAATLILFVCSGCVAISRPRTLWRPLTVDERKILSYIDLDNYQLPVRIGVKEFEHKRQSDRLIQSLRESGLFTQVDYMTTYTTAPDLVAEIEEANFASAPVPIFTMMTLGLFPTITHDDYGHRFSVYKQDSSQKIAVDLRARSTFVMGWLAIPLLLHPNWSQDHYDPYIASYYSRFQELFNLKMMSQRLTIKNLLKNKIVMGSHNNLKSKGH